MKTYQITAGFLMVCTITGLITAYPNKVTITNTLPDQITAYATLAQATPQGSEVSQMIPAHGTVTFQGKMYTKVRAVLRGVGGSVCQGTSCMQTQGADEDSFAFDKNFSGEIKLQFDATHKLKVK